MNKPHKSTTTPEYFFHINNEATVFFRKETTGNQWQASVALRDPRDQFSRKAGRCVARRKYFQGKRFSVTIESDRPTYGDAVDVAARGRRVERLHAFRAVKAMGGAMDLLKVLGISN